MDNVKFISPFASRLEVFIKSKRAEGLRYGIESKYLKNFDRWCVDHHVTEASLTQDIAEGWCTKRLEEKSKTHSNRQSILRQFALFLIQGGEPAYGVPLGLSCPFQNYTPYIFSESEIAALFEAADTMRANGYSPYMHEIMPMALRILYCCGLRTSELQNLKRIDVDLNKGVLAIINSKNAKDRLVPMSDDLTARLHIYCERMECLCPETEFLFPNRNGNRLGEVVIYRQFRKLLQRIGIPHYGRGKGPRVHDARHTFAVDSMRKMQKDGMDLYTALPILSAYLGHASIAATEKYVRMTPRDYPDITEQLRAAYGEIILPARTGAAQ